MNSDKHPEPTDEQWEAIRSADEHLLVSASAGTGKTYTIVTKILYLLGVPIRGEVCPSPIELDEIAAITFTNKAAAELKAKLRDALRAVGRQREAYRIDGARIGTIHSFCADVLREFALRTGRAPKLHLVEDAESVLMRGEVVRDALLAALEDAAIDGLDQVVAEYTVGKVEGEVTRLLDQGNQLPTLFGHASQHRTRERAVLELARHAHELMVKRLEEAGQVDFDHVIGWTRDLIQDDATVRSTLQRRIKVLFIDEFQDVDPAQREIAYLLGEPQSWRTQTTRLVLVGDPKQSIYRFRNADVTVWRRVEHDFSARGWKNARVVPLLGNRRSFAPILGFIDHTVGKLLDRSVAGGEVLQDFETPYASMHSLRTDAAPARAVEIVTIPAADGGKVRSSEDVRSIEARTLAERVRELHGASGMAWRDIAVLLCGWGAAEMYDAALKARGVPTYILRDEGFYSRLEITDVLVALDAIRNPFDDRLLFGVLRSPFIGVTDESLLRIVQQCTQSPCWPALRTVILPEPREQELLTRGIKLLTRLGELRDRVSTAELIETLLMESGYFAHLELLNGDAKQRIANLRKLVRLARSMADLSVGDFLEAVARNRDVETREGEAQLYGANEDVVTITSVHCAKGLEWKAVFWCDLVRTPPHAKKELAITRDAVRMPPADDTNDPEFDALKNQLDLERRGESKRLWYVAATRAKDLLVVSGIPLGTGGRIGGSPAEAIRDALPTLNGESVEYRCARGVRYEAKVRVATVDDVEAEVAEVAAGIGAEQFVKPYKPVFAPVGRGHHSATELLSMSRCERRHWLRYVVGLKEPPLERHGSGDHTNAIKRGLIVHDVLEHYQEDIELGVLLEAAIGRWDPDAPAPEAQPGVAYRRRLANNVEAILGRVEYRDVLDRDGARRELGFTHARTPGEYLEGKIDLVAPGAHGYDIVDVKTTECDEHEAAKKAEQYAPQRAAYSEAVEAISGAPVASFGLQFAGAGAHMSRVRGEAERARDAQLVEGLLHEMRAGSRELTQYPAECGFCGYKQAGWCSGAAAESPAVPELGSQRVGRGYGRRVG